MARFCLLLCLCLLRAGASRGSVERFLHQVPAPKCCSHGEMVVFNSTEDGPLVYSCMPDVNKTSAVLTGDIQENFLSNSSEASCIDATFDGGTGKRAAAQISSGEVKNLEHLNYFPKCCPINAAYDKVEHKCVQVTNNTDQSFVTFEEEFLKEHLHRGLFLIVPSITKCYGVVVDYELSVFDWNHFDKDRGFRVSALNETVPYKKYCVDKLHNSKTYVARVCHSSYDACKKTAEHREKIRCIRKCCPDGSIYKGGAKCKPSFAHGLNFANDSKITNRAEPFAITHGLDCRKYMVDPAWDWDYVVDEMGNVKLNLPEDHSSYSPLEHTYCYEHVDMGILQDRRLFMCFKHQDKNKIEFQITRIALLLSSIFLVLTLIGYLMLPEMRNLHGKTLMCHCGSLLVASLFLVVMQFHPKIEGPACMISGYIVMYTFLASFMWSNIMCFDIWWTFGSMKVQGIHQKRKELKRFLWYCLYAFSVPAVITGATFAMQTFGDSLPEAIQPIVPQLGGFNCFFEQATNTAAFLTWFTLPIAIIIICNFVLYIKTIIYCYKVKNEIERIKDSNKNERKKLLLADKERMKMAVKLFLVMGISWLFESISVCTIPVPATGAAQVIQIIFDTINCLQGVFIFCIFILKTKFIHALQKKVGTKYLRRTSQSTTSALTVTTYVLPTTATSKV